MKSIYHGKTIDTISRVVLDIAHYKKSDQFKLGGNSLIVNRHSTSDGNFLYINSDRLGRYEDGNELESASIIDVYNIEKRNYEFSFYIYHQRDKTLSDFKVNNGLLVAIVEEKLWLYQLKNHNLKAH